MDPVKESDFAYPWMCKVQGGIVFAVTGGFVRPDLCMPATGMSPGRWERIYVLSVKAPACFDAMRNKHEKRKRKGMQVWMKIKL